MRLVGREVKPGLAREELADELGQAVLRYRAQGGELCWLGNESLAVAICRCPERQCIMKNIQPRIRTFCIAAIFRICLFLRFLLIRRREYHHAQRCLRLRHRVLRQPVSRLTQFLVFTGPTELDPEILYNAFRAQNDRG